jgi:hypothetical protein
MDLGVVIEECSPPQIVSRLRDFYSTAGGNQQKLRSRGGFEAVSPLSHMNRHKENGPEKRNETRTSKVRDP